MDLTVIVGGQVIPWPIVGFFTFGYCIVLANLCLAFNAFLNWTSGR